MRINIEIEADGQTTEEILHLARKHLLHDVFERFDHFEKILRRIEEMADTQQQQLDALIATIGTGVSDLASALTTASSDLVTAFNDFAAKIAATPGAPDLSQELANLNSAATAISSAKDAAVKLDAAIKAGDPGSSTPPVPPAPAPTPSA